MFSFTDTVSNYWSEASAGRGQGKTAAVDRYLPQKARKDSSEQEAQCGVGGRCRLKRGRSYPGTDTQAQAKETEKVRL